MGQDEFSTELDAQNRHSRALIPQRQQPNQVEMMTAENPWKKTMKTFMIQQTVDPPHVPLTQQEILAQKSDFERDFYAKMVKREFQHRLTKDYFLWQS